MRALARTGSAQMSAPNTVEVPASGRSSPAAIDSVVVLPAPFGPTQPEERSRRDGEVGEVGEVDVVDRGVAAEGLGESGEVERGPAVARPRPTVTGGPAERWGRRLPSADAGDR